MLRQEGILALMTDTWQSIEKFGTWHYIRDFTHVCFYNILTMSWLAEKYGMSLIYTDSRRVFIFQKDKKRLIFWFQYSFTLEDSKYHHNPNPATHPNATATKPS